MTLKNKKKFIDGKVLEIVDVPEQYNVEQFRPYSYSSFAPIGTSVIRLRSARFVPLHHTRSLSPYPYLLPFTVRSPAVSLHLFIRRSRMVSPSHRSAISHCKLLFPGCEQRYYVAHYVSSV